MKLAWSRQRPVLTSSDPQPIVVLYSYNVMLKRVLAAPRHWTIIIGPTCLLTLRDDSGQVALQYSAVPVQGDA